MKKEVILKIVIFLIVAALIAAAFPYIQEYAKLDYIKAQKESFAEVYENNRSVVIGGFFLLYVFVTALSLPGAALMTLLAGALFGLAAGVVVVSFASSIGATLAFLVARFLFGESLQKKYGDKLVKINEGIEKEGAFYLFAMRLVPAFPFFLVNLLMALTTLKALTFYWVSQSGMLIGTIVYVYAGTELGKLESLGDILSPTLIGAFVALGIFPLLAKKILSFIRNKREKKNL